MVGLYKQVTESVLYSFSILYFYGKTEQDKNYHNVIKEAGRKNWVRFIIFVAKE